MWFKMKINGIVHDAKSNQNSLIRLYLTEYYLVMLAKHFNLLHFETDTYREMNFIISLLPKTFKSASMETPKWTVGFLLYKPGKYAH